MSGYDNAARGADSVVAGAANSQHTLARILLADADDVQLREDFAGLLERAGFDVAVLWAGATN